MQEKAKIPVPTKKAKLKSCIKKLRFYFDAMCVTQIMDDVEDRKAFIQIIQDLKDVKKETS